MKITKVLFICSLFLSISVKAQDDIQTLDLLFVGDIMGHSPQIKSAYNATTKSYDYQPCFKYVKSIIEGADLAVGNLEVTLSNQGRYTGYPMFRSPDALAYALKNAGFDMLVTANNHSNDNGAYGVTHTLEVLDSLGFYHTGTFRNQFEKDIFYPLLVYKNDFRIAFLNYTYGTNGMPTVAPTIVNEIDEELIQSDIIKANKLNPDAVIVIMHWGAEYQLNESEVQYNLAKKMMEWGADLIIGAHPHVIQPIKKISYERNGIKKEGLCVFSMGNFISNQQQTNTDGGLMVEIQLQKEKGAKKASVSQCQYIPVWRYRNRVNEKNPMGTYYAIPISAFENENETDLILTKEAMKQMQSFGKRMREHLKKYEGKERTIKYSDIKLGMNQSQNRYASFASLTDSLIIPLDTDRYIIHDKSKEKAKPNSNNNIPNIVGETTSKSGANLSNTSAIPQENQAVALKNGTETKDKYLIQFQATKSLYLSNLPFSNVIVKEKNGFFQYFLAAGNDLDIAKSTLNEVRNSGFSDAFIVVNTFNDLPKQYNGMTAKSGKISSTLYKIQFQSSYKLVVPQNLPVDEYEVIEAENGQFRYFVGKEHTLDAAKELLKKIQAVGYKDAFIVPFSNEKPR